MNKILMTALIITLPMAATASRYNNNVSYGQVIEAVPIYQNVSIPEERQVCDRRRHDNYHNQRKNNKTGSTLLGGIIGGAIGNKFGRGRGRDASTALGVLIGASIGANKQNSNQRNSCYIETYYHNEQRMVGYDVTYEYKGEMYQTQMQDHPGDRVRLRVNVDVIE